MKPVPKPSQNWIAGEPTKPKGSDWPRLTEQFPTTSPAVCASCGDQASEFWRECDHRDKPEDRFIALCSTCGKLLVGPHPRLYIQIDWNAPRPGMMPTCGNCKYRDVLKCTHPALKANGGAGLPLQTCHPITGMIDSKTYRGRFCHYASPTICKAKEKA